MPDSQHQSQLISIVIPCYNHGQYLAEAIASIYLQSHPAVEVVVVDDGSTDNTSEVASAYPQVRYVYQQNQGLSAARNTGVKNSRGAYLVFLDADDWLYPGALEINLRYLQQNQDAAFVSGAFSRILVEENQTVDVERAVTSEHYLQLLQGNYIGMHATVMYRRWVFDKFEYDTSLRASEDYDLYLKIARKHPVLHHTEKIAAYRMHTTNMSSNIPLMLNSVLKVLKRQETVLHTGKEKTAFANGIANWKNYYCKELYQKLRTGKAPVSKASYLTLLRYQPKLMLKYLGGSWK